MSGLGFRCNAQRHLVKYSGRTELVLAGPRLRILCLTLAFDTKYKCIVGIQRGITRAIRVDWVTAPGMDLFRVRTAK